MFGMLGTGYKVYTVNPETGEIVTREVVVLDQYEPYRKLARLLDEFGVMRERARSERDVKRCVRWLNQRLQAI